MIAYYLVDDIAERYIDLLDAVDDEIDELEEGVDDWPRREVRARIAELRHDLLHIRKTLAPTRDAVREVVDGRVDIEGRTCQREVFPREVEQQFATTTTSCSARPKASSSRATCSPPPATTSRPASRSTRTRSIKRLTSIASILLVPTFIVGLYGQNFVHMPEYRWRFGYAWSWCLILATTVGQVVYFRRKRWL